jgi:hypothetical protein
MDEIVINKIEWSAPEYTHKERGNDWFWALGLITLVAVIVAIILKNYVFAIFLLAAGGTLIMFTMRPPQHVGFIVETKGLTMGKDLHTWKNLKSFNIKSNDHDEYAKLLIETSKYFLPIYTIPLPKGMVDEMKETLLKVLPRSEIDESKSMVFMEKLGF